MLGEHTTLAECQREMEPIQAGEQCQDLAHLTLSLCEVLLRCKGVDPSTLPFSAKEKKRLEVYRSKINKAEAKVKKRTLTLDVDAANRFIAAAQGRSSKLVKSRNTSQQKGSEKDAPATKRKRDPALSFLDDLSIQKK